MATPRIVTIRDFTTSRWAQLAETTQANIGDVLARAEQAIEDRIARPIYPKAYTEVMKPNSNVLYLRYRPIVSVDEIRRGYSLLPTAVVDTQSYRVDATLGVVYSRATLIGQTVEVDYTAGYTVPPLALVEAILIQAALFLFQDFEIYGSGDSKKPGILYLYDDIDRLIAPYAQLNTAFTS